MKIDLSITPSAQAFVKQHWQLLEKEMVIVFVPVLKTEVIGESTLRSGDADSIEKVIELGRIASADLPRSGFCNWETGAALKKRFPKSDIYEFHGISFYLPQPIVNFVHGRTLVLEGQSLKLTPELEPYYFSRD